MIEWEKDWKKEAEMDQRRYFEIFSSRRYDEIPKTNLFVLRKKVGYGTFGIPNDLPKMSNYYTGYSEEQIKFITPICNKIIEKSDTDDGTIRFACAILILCHGKETSQTTVFRIITSNGSSIFIDTCARTYLNWEQYMSSNKLPDCEYCYPLNGEYFTDNKDMKVGFAWSPASSLFSKAIDYADRAGSVASVAAAGVFATSLAITVAPAALAVAGTTAACSAVYSASRNIGTLYDRNNHEQSIGLDNEESRSAWLNVGASALCVGTGAALDKAKKIVEGGESLGNAAKYGLHVLTATSVAFSGYGFYESFMGCVEKYQKGTMTQKDVFDLSCEMLFLFNALASAKATTNLINSMATASEGPSVQKKLTKTQKRNLRKRAAKRRAKGIPGPVTTEEAKISETPISTYLQEILLSAINVLLPEVRDLLHICQSIGHDIKSYREGNMDCLHNIIRSFNELYTMFKDEFDDIIKKVVNFFKNVFNGNYEHKFYQWFYSCSEELQSLFVSKIVNMEEEFETVISESERDIMEMHEQLGVQLSDSTHNDNVDDSNDSDLSPEAQSLLSKCEEMGLFSDTLCNNLEELSDIIEEAKYVIVSVYKEKVANYRKSLEAAKSASETFDIKKFHATLGINCDVSQHYFNETIRLSSCNFVFNVKKKLKLLRRDRNMRSSRVWGVYGTDNVYQFCGTPGAGLVKEEILSIVRCIIHKDLEEGSYKWLDNDLGIVMIEINDNDRKSETQDESSSNDSKVESSSDDCKPKEIVVSYKLNEERTVFGLILILK